jgi:hypothetical protein
MEPSRAPPIDFVLVSFAVTIGENTTESSEWFEKRHLEKQA